MEVSRSYTPVPPCLHPDDMAPSYRSDCLCLMIKKYPNGALSPSITALQSGQTLMLSNALGAFVVESFDRYSVIHMLVGGTGLTAMLGIVQRALARRIVLVYSRSCTFSTQFALISLELFYAKWVKLIWRPFLAWPRQILFIWHCSKSLASCVAFLWRKCFFFLVFNWFVLFIKYFSRWLIELSRTIIYYKLTSFLFSPGRP